MDEEDWRRPRPPLLRLWPVPRAGPAVACLPGHLPIAAPHWHLPLYLSTVHLWVSVWAAPSACALVSLACSCRSLLQWPLLPPAPPSLHQCPSHLYLLVWLNCIVIVPCILLPPPDSSPLGGGHWAVPLSPGVQHRPTWPEMVRGPRFPSLF